MATFTVNADDSSPLLIYSPTGAWSDSPASDTLLSSYSSGSLHTSSTQGATVTINFNGNGIEIFGGTRPNYGTFSITVDGNTIKSGSAQSQQPAFKQVLAAVANLSNGPHTAVLTNTGTSPIDVDYVAIQNTLGQPGASLVTTTYDDSDQRVTYQPASAWQTNTGAAFMGETLHYSSDPNAAASLTFTGEAYAIYGTVSPDHANIEVSVDGQVKETMAGGSGGVVSMLHSQTLLYYGNDLGPGQHTVTVKSAQGSNSGPYLDIDSFLVFSTSGGTPQPLNNNDAPLVASNTLAQPVASPTKHAHSQQVGLPLGAIIGIAVGGAVAILVLLLIAFFLVRRRRQQQKSMTVPMEQSPASPDLPIQKPYMVEAGFSLVSPQVENVPRPLYRAPSSRAFPAHMSQRESMYSSSSSVSSHSRSESTTSTTPMVTREVPLLKTPRPPPPARSASPLASSRPVRPLNRPPTMDFPT